MSVKVSVIIPVYNVEKYIRQTLDSVVNRPIKLLKLLMNMLKKMTDLLFTKIVKI